MDYRTTTKLFLTVVAAFILTSSSHPINDYSQFTGSQQAVGNDGSFEVAANTAYLGYPTDGKKFSASLKQASLFYLEIENPLFENQLPDNVFIANTFFGFSVHGLGDRFHLGIYADNSLKKDFGDQPYYQIFQAQLPGLSTVNSSNVLIGLTENFYEAGFGLAFKLDDYYSFGINFFYGLSQRSFKKQIDVDFKTSIGEPGVVTHTEGIESKVTNYGLRVGYVNKTEFGELAIMVKPLDYMVQENTRTLDFDFFVNNVSVSDVTGDIDYQNKLFEPVLVTTGLSQVFLSIFKFFLEVGVEFPKEWQEKSIELTYPPASAGFPVIIEFEVNTEVDYSPILAAGFAVEIPKLFTVYGGFNAQKKESFVLYVNQYDSDDNIARFNLVESWAMQLGFSREIIKNLNVYLGFEYKSSYSSSEESEYTLGALEETKYSKTYTLFNTYIASDYAF